VKTWRAVLYGVGLLIPVAAIFFAVHVAREFDREQELATRPEFFEQIDEPPPPPEFDEEPAAEIERRELPIEGWVFRGDGSPFAGVQVAIGEEVAGAELAGSEADGGFRFPPALRPRLETVRVLADGAELAVFHAVVTGDGSAKVALADGAAPGSRNVAPAQPERIRWTVHIAPGRVPPDPPARSARRPRFSIVLDTLLWEDWGHGARAHVRGSTDLPEGASIYSSLRFDGHIVAPSLGPAVVEEHRWECALVLQKAERTYSGDFELSASFNPRFENPNAIERWSAEHPGVDFLDLDEVVAHRTVFLGVRAEAEAEDRETGEYVQGVLVQARRYHGGLLSRVDELLEIGKGWDPRLLAARRDARVGWFHEDFLDEDGIFDEGRWRQFLDDRWRPGLAALREAHRQRGGGKYIDAYDRINQLLGAIFEMSFVYSRFVVYPHFERPLHPNDMYFDEEGAGDLDQLRQIVSEHFEALERFAKLGGGATSAAPDRSE
jgi:hypothetical protein